MDNIKKKIAVIDGNSWTHRAYHAVPPVMSLDDGTPTNAVHGFMNMFLSFYEKAQPDAIICAFDAGIPQFRLKAVKQYKAQRKPMDNELRVQFPIIEEMLKAMEIPVIKVDGWEGDDILGTIAAKCEKLGFESLLITGDKDANQLASNLTKIVNMKKGVSDVVLFGPDEVFEKYGVKVDQFIDFLALMGDSSDNIPGVPGIGPKSAATLLQDFNSLEGIYDNLDKLKGKQLENIKENKESAYISRQAATISKDVPIDIDLNNLYFPSFDKEALSETFLKYKMRSALTGLLKIIGEDDTQYSEDDKQDSSKAIKENNDNSFSKNINPPICKKPIPDFDYENYLSGNSANEFVEKLLNSEEIFSLAVSYKMEEPVVQASLFDIEDEDKYQYPEQKNLIVAFASANSVAILESDDAINYLLKAFDCDKEYVCENAKDLFEIVFPKKNNAQKLIDKHSLYRQNIFDISLSAYLLNSSKSEYTSIDAFSQVFNKLLPTIEFRDEKNTKNQDKEYVLQKNENLKLRLSRRAVVAYILKPFIKDLLVECDLYNVFTDIELPLTKVLVELQNIGAKIDVSSLNNLSSLTANLLNNLEKEIFELADCEFNIDSPKQLGHILFEVLSLPAKKKTKTGYSTAADVLEDLAKIHPLPAKVIEYREYAKLKSTYIDALPKLVDNNDIVHTSFHQKVTTTGRLSSSEPNLQNIPTRSNFGNKIRECFIPFSVEQLFMTADYSQIELRVLAHLSQDKGLIEAFNSGEDFHSYTAANVFNVPVDQVDANMRRKAKAVNFGIVYGQQAFGLSQTLNIEVSEAKQMIEKYFSTYPRVREYLDEVVLFATENGYSKTMFGRRRYIPELNSPNKRFVAFGQRTAMNHPMQGSAADIIKIAMIEVCSAIHENNLESKCILQVHDELDFSVCKDELEMLSALVKDKMENAVKLDVPLIVDVATGPNWALAK